MIVGFALAVIAGLVTRHAEPAVRRALEGALRTELRLAPGETTIMTLLLLLALSALVTASFGLNTVSLATVLGGAAGYFGRPLVAFLRDPDGPDISAPYDRQGRAGRHPHAVASGADGGTAQTGASGGHDADVEALKAVGEALRDARPDLSAAAGSGAGTSYGTHAAQRTDPGESQR